MECLHSNSCNSKLTALDVTIKFYFYDRIKSIKAVISCDINRKVYTQEFGILLRTLYVFRWLCLRSQFLFIAQIVRGSDVPDDDEFISFGLFAS